MAQLQLMNSFIISSREAAEELIVVVLVAFKVARKEGVSEGDVETVLP